jgi:hypothetical protein
LITGKLTILEGLECIRNLQQEQFLKLDVICEFCNRSMSINMFKKHRIMYAWRCANRNCVYFKSYTNIRKNSFFMGLDSSLKHIFKVILGYAVRQQRFSLALAIPILKPTMRKILKKFIQNYSQQILVIIN